MDFLARSQAAALLCTENAWALRIPDPQAASLEQGSQSAPVTYLAKSRVCAATGLGTVGWPVASLDV